MTRKTANSQTGKAGAAMRRRAVEQAFEKTVPNPELVASRMAGFHIDKVFSQADRAVLREIEMSGQMTLGHSSARKRR